MRMELERGSTGPAILGFSGTSFRIDDTVAPAALLTAEFARAWTPPAVPALTLADLADLVAARPEFILFGTGRALVHPPVALVRALEADGIGVEAMDSRAAARAWGVLRGEGRQIAAALYPLDA